MKTGQKHHAVTTCHGGAMGFDLKDKALLRIRQKWPWWAFDRVAAFITTLCSADAARLYRNNAGDYPPSRTLCFGQRRMNATTSS